MIAGSDSNECQLLRLLYQYHPTTTNGTSPQSWVVALRKPVKIQEISGQGSCSQSPDWQEAQYTTPPIKEV